MLEQSHTYSTYTLAQAVRPVPASEALAQQRRAQLDVIIVAVYLLTVIYILHRAYNSLVDQTEYRVDAKTVDGMPLGESDLKDLVDMNCSLGGRHAFPDQPKYLTVSLTNKSTDGTIYVDWDASTLVDYSGRSHRVIRMTIDRKVDLSQQQVYSVVSPGNTLKEELAAEGFLKANVDGTLEAKEPLVDLGKAAKANGALFGAFLAGKDSVKFTLRLMIRVSQLHDGERSDRWYAVACVVGMYKVPRRVYFPFVPK